ncbi:MAG TPA: DUF488 domain-containing protein [Planctomycetaceae bacterium]|nr:DUF488 domain-containing protein [Planctomycetaceae bacterium]
MMCASASKDRCVLTIGHSNYEAPVFIELLRQHGIEVVADVRSQPYATYATHFSAPEIEQLLTRAGIRYVFLGGQLGGRPEGPEFYDGEGYVLYDRLAASSSFREGIARLERGIERYRVAILCSEENPAECHRNLLVGRVLAGRGIQVRHIRGDGRLQSQEELEGETRGDAPGQQYLFDDLQDAEDRPWKSTRSVLREPPPLSSSGD